jgi:tetratricopeptide (TPR) repeat protein
MTITDKQALQLALRHHEAGRLAEEEAIYRQILAGHPNHADAWHLLGLLAVDAGRGDEGVECIRKAIASDPAQPLYLSNLGEVCRRSGRLAEAIASFEQALQLRPDLPEALVNLGSALIDARRFHEAIPICQRALALRPDLPQPHNTLGSAWIEIGRIDDAVNSIRCALALQPDFPEAHHNLGVALSHRGEWEPAIACFHRALALKPNFADAHYNLGCLLLLLGCHEEGWRQYEWRWRDRGFAGWQRASSAPRWEGTRLDGRTLLLHAEQGFGDAIQFLRYVPLVRERAGAARVIVACPRELLRLLAQTGDWNAEIIDRDGCGGLPSFDVQLPLLSLPLVLEKMKPLTMPHAYLRAAPELRAAWRERLGPAADFRVGVAWAGSPLHLSDHRRSIAPERFLASLRMPGVSCHSLQVEPRTPPDAGIPDLAGHLGDFADTAALIAELDLIITVDTAVAHLAGALGRPVWTLLPFIPDWRWGLEREDTPWYPTMRLFRQPAAGDWDSVIQRIVGELRVVASKPGHLSLLGAH